MNWGIHTDTDTTTQCKQTTMTIGLIVACHWDKNRITPQVYIVSVHWCSGWHVICRQHSIDYYWVNSWLNLKSDLDTGFPTIAWSIVLFRTVEIRSFGKISSSNESFLCDYPVSQARWMLLLDNSYTIYNMSGANKHQSITLHTINFIFRYSHRIYNSVVSACEMPNYTRNLSWKWDVIRYC